MLFAIGNIQFSPRLVPTLAAIATLALTLYLGAWQQGRAEQKRGLQADFMQRTSAPALFLDSSMRDANLLNYRRAIARGEWVSEGQIFLDNKIDDVNSGRAGYHVITPLRLAGSNTYVLVNRGWVARSAHYPKPPMVTTPTGVIEVHGLNIVPNAHFLELSNAAIEGPVWQNLTIERYRKATKLEVLSIVLLAAETLPDSQQGLLRVTEQPNAGVDKHIEYMLTWYSLAAAVAALWIGLNIKRVAIQPSAQSSSE